MESHKELKKIRRMAKAINHLQGLIAMKQIKTSELSVAEPNDVITTAEMCSRFKLDRLVVYELIRRGDLEAKKSKGWEISMASINAYLSQIVEELPW